MTLQPPATGGDDRGTESPYQGGKEAITITHPGQTRGITDPGKTTAIAAPTTLLATTYLWAITRLCMGLVFLWPFLDKTFGLGHETSSAHAWIRGGSPSKGFLSGSAGCS